ncbi:MAG: Uncharacterised protein [Bacteroidetes bacterium MED-G17]|nr:MAG: Uncharacterised protein [Bacteroidetes bacterium MED-G17]
MPPANFALNVFEIINFARNLGSGEKFNSDA